MYMILVGGGKVGYHLAKALLAEGHEVLVIEKDRSRIDFICNDLGSICLMGDGCETTVQAEAGTNRADMLISVTGDDEDNLVACQVAKHKFKVPRTIARSSDPKNETLFHMLGIDVTVSSTSVIMEIIQKEVPTHILTRLLPIQNKGFELVRIKIPADAKSVGKKIKDLALPPETTFILIIRRDQKPQTASPDSKIQTGDELIGVTLLENEEQLKIALKGD
jgi:trk system potassium uptake protein TrkA